VTTNGNILKFGSFLSQDGISLTENAHGVK